MRAEKILRQLLAGLEADVHRARLRVVKAAVVALVMGGAIALSTLGRCIAARRSKPKHGIKCIDRLFGNEALASEVTLFYAALIGKVIASERRPLILVDWTDAGAGVCALTAAVPMEGRAIPIYTLTCYKRQLANRGVERRFLNTLRDMLPADCVPIIVTDAGFRGPWLRHVRALGWDYLARVRGGVMVREHDQDDWRRSKTLFDLATAKPTDLGCWQLVRNRPYSARLVTVKSRSKRRRKPSTTPGTIRGKRCATAAREPWLLATSLTTMAPQEVTAIYAKRMQIEETFRDLKSHRFGWGFSDARSTHPNRVAIQILLAAIASLVATLVGMAAYSLKLHKAHQANTVTSRRVFSVVTLGRLVIRSPTWPKTLDRGATLALAALSNFVGIH